MALSRVSSLARSEGVNTHNVYTEAEPRALKIIRGESIVSGLAEGLDRSRNYAPEFVDRMEVKGLVHTTRKGQRASQIHSAQWAV